MTGGLNRHIVISQYCDITIWLVLKTKRLPDGSRLLLFSYLINKLSID